MKYSSRNLRAMLASIVSIACLSACEPDDPQRQVSQQLQSEIQDKESSTEEAPVLAPPSDELPSKRECRWYTQSSDDAKLVTSYCPLRSRVVTGGCRTQFGYITRSAPFVGDEKRSPKDGEHWSAVGERGTWTGWNCARPEQDDGELIAMALCCEYY